jgi:hypothetical protein
VQHEQYLISLVERQLNQLRMDQIYKAEELLVTLASWKNKAINMDCLWRQ